MITGTASSKILLIVAEGFFHYALGVPRILVCGCFEVENDTDSEKCAEVVITTHDCCTSVFGVEVEKVILTSP